MVPRPDRSNGWGIIAVASLAIACSPSLASWEYVPEEVRMLEADLVVAGEIVKRGKSLKKHGQVYEVGIIEPIQVLKGDPGEGKQIRLAWPQIAPRLRAPQIGDKSIWILRADETLPVYRATYLMDRQPLENLDAVRERISTLENTRWSEPKDGLQIGLFTEQRDLPDATLRKGEHAAETAVQLAVYPLLKNGSDEPIYINVFQRDMPFSFLCFAPDGSPMDVPAYRVSAMEATAPERRDFLLVPPGGIRAAPHGFLLPVLTESGDYSIRVRYKSSREATEWALHRVWRGAMASPAVAVQVPATEGGER